MPQTYNQHRGVAHTAATPEGLAEFFIRAMSPEDGVVIDPFAGGGTTVVVVKRLGRRAGGFEIHGQFVEEAHRRIGLDIADDVPGAGEGGLSVAGEASSSGHRARSRCAPPGSCALPGTSAN